MCTYSIMSVPNTINEYVMMRVRYMHSVFGENETTYWEGIIERDRQPSATVVITLRHPWSSRSSIQSSFMATDYLEFMRQKVDLVLRSTEGAPPPTFPPGCHSWN